jgi:predicted transport protein
MMEKGLLEQTGKPLSHWIKVVQQSGLEKHKAMIDFLKAEHGFTYGYANFVAHKARQSDAASSDDQTLIEEQYRGKEALRPVYEQLAAAITQLGDDVTVTPKKASVSFIRKFQFVLIKPATKTRIDLGLKLKGVPTTERLGNSGPFGTMCTHRVQITGLADVDDELLGWIKQAYEASV